MDSRVRQFVACGVAGFFLLWLITINYSSATQSRIATRKVAETRIQHAKRAADDSWRDTIKLGPAHANPALAPPPPLSPEDLGLDLRLYDANLTRRQLDKPNTGPLYCTDGPCVDDSCCGPKGICGYGPDFCDAGCTSNCDALAMCGEYSEDANMPCGMKLCCSATGWCGTFPATDVYCHNADPLHGTLPCQAGYGSCAITGPPSCPKGSGSSKGRTIGYYQSWNARTRECNKVLPKQLDTKGYTHLFFSFAFINPSSFHLEPAHPDDIELMKEFTSLSKDRGVKTWIAVGGFDFSNKEAATHRTWSQMVATKDNRARFIESARTFMDTYGFTGIDLDWEYPGAPERGGNKLADTRNLSLLMKEMRAAYGSKYGISLTLAPDYWYLRWFDAKAIEPHVDFLGFMAYDLHGSWDADVKALGSKVRGQADIREIEANTIPLWFDGLTPSKLNFGLAMYGRGYTLSDPSCSDLLCPFSGPSKPAPCTNFEGVMSLVEIQQLIKKRNLKPKFLEQSLMKQITWDDQWIGYDDEETFEAKRNFADGLCFGGTMIWSIDFQVPGSGSPDEPEVVYLDPAVYEGTPAQCTGPCQLVFPPRPLGSTTTISLQPYTTSIQLRPGTTTTLTLRPPPIVTNVIDYYNVNITSNEGTKTITPIASLTIAPITTTITLQGGETQVRTLTLPPWPAISGIPSGGDGPTGTAPGTRTRTTTKEPTLRPVIPLPPKTKWPLTPFPTERPGTQPGTQPGPEPTRTWPPQWEIVPVESEVPDEGDDDDNDPAIFYVSCRLWFFSLCIDWPEFGIKIRGWKWNLPVGIHGPFPPPIPRIKFPPGITVKGTLPVWPALTVLPDGTFSPPPKPDGCEPAEASLCLTTSAFGTTVTNGVTRTTATHVKSTCATITGCHLRDVEETKTVEACKLTRRAIEAADVAEATAMPKMHKLEERDEPDWGCEQPWDDGIIILLDGSSSSQRAAVKAALERRDQALKNWNDNKQPGEEAKLYGHREIRSNKLGYTAFFFVNSLGPASAAYLGDFYDDNMAAMYHNRYGPNSPSPGSPSSPVGKRSHADAIGNGTLASEDTASSLLKRALQHEQTNQWHLSMLSWPEDIDFSGKYKWSNNIEHNADKSVWSYAYDDSGGRDQTIYIMEADWPDVDRATPWLKNRPRKIDTPDWGMNQDQPNFDDWDHGKLVGFYAAGIEGGVAPNAKLVFVRNGINGGPLKYEKCVEALMLIADDAASTDSIVNLSFGLAWYEAGHQQIADDWCTIMKMMEDRLGIVFILAGNYDDREAQSYPDFCMRNLDGGLLVGAVDKQGAISDDTPLKEDPDVFAPGMNLPYPDGMEETGTSYAAPMVAGLAAYFRALGSATNPAAMRQKIVGASRAIFFGDDEVLVAWNEQGRPAPAEGSNNPPACRRDLQGRQSCELPGVPGGGPNPRGPVVSYKPGPPAPLCTANCGKYCEGYYCVPNPTGTPPDFVSPTPKPTTTAGNGGNGGNGGNNGGNTNSNGGNGGGFPTLPPNPDPTAPPGEVCLTSTTVVECNGGPRGGVCITRTSCASFGPTHLPGLPTLSADGPYSGPGCASYSSTSSCNGSGGQAACVTGQICVPSQPPCPAFPTMGTPWCPSDFPLCIKPTTTLRCGLQGRAEETAAPELSSKSQVAQAAEEERGDEPVSLDADEIVEDDLNTNNTGLATTEQLLGVRQAAPRGCGGSSNGGCDVINICATGFCARVETMSCVVALVSVYMHPIDSELSLKIYEDGEEVCSVDLKCKTINTPGCLEDQADREHDCGNGKKIQSWKGLSTIDFVSNKNSNNQHYFLYMGQDGSNDYDWCHVFGRLWSLCIGSSWGATAGLCLRSAKRNELAGRQLLELSG
ncbi:oviduct-specific glycoprotein [Paramyrothecium foliicola]|nr:oviduct-specific glycoprotein [Paramyrothecium foliicola]